MALAVLAGAAAAVSPPSIEAQAAEGTDVARTVRVDPQGWATTSADPAVTVVCTVDQVAAHLIDRTAVVLSGVRHRGPLELRGRTGVTVRGEAGAVLDATGARFALSLRDVADVAVRDLVLSGGTAQTVWVERTRGVTLERVVVQGSAGSGVQVRDSAGFSLTASRVQDAASAGVMELTGVTDSRYTGLVVLGNGHGAAAYNGDGLQLCGTRGERARRRDDRQRQLRAVRARAVRLDGRPRRHPRRCALVGQRRRGAQAGRQRHLEAFVLVDDRIALYCGTTDAAGWTVRTTSRTAPPRSVAEKGCSLAAV